MRSFTFIKTIPDANDILRLVIKNNAVIADGGGQHGQWYQHQRHKMTDDVVLVMVDVWQEVMVQHAPQAPPHVDRGEVSDEDRKHVEGPRDVQLGAARGLREVVQSVGDDEGTVAHEERIYGNISILFTNYFYLEIYIINHKFMPISNV